MVGFQKINKFSSKDHSSPFHLPHSASPLSSSPVVEYVQHKIYHFNYFEEFSYVNYILNAVQLSPLVLSKTFSIPQTETLR